MIGFKKIWWLVPQILVLLFAFSLALNAQSTNQKLIAQAKQFLEDKKIDQAREILLAALKNNLADYEANRLLADTYFKNREWKPAIKYYKKTFINKPENSYAHFHIGICEREKGQFQNPISRRLSFNRSEKHFIKVLQKDPFYEMVYHEYAELELYRKHYRKAIDLCLNGLSIQPRDTESKQDIFKFYDLYLEDGERGLGNVLNNSDSLQLTWLKSRNSVYDRFMIGEKYRRIGQFNRADSILSSLIASPLEITKVPIYLARVRLYYQMGRDQEAERDYWQALDNVKSFYEFQFFFEDMKYIMSDSDLNVRLPNLSAIRQFYRHFWSSHNTFPGSRQNLRLAEHYRRLVMAEKNYRFDEQRLPTNTPDMGKILEFPKIFYKNKKFNDKGLVYLRYGQPDDIAVSPSAGLLSNESWLYYATPSNPKLIFHFEVQRNARPSDWRLVALPSQFDMLESRIGWDPLLDSYYTASSTMDQMSIMAKIQMDAKEKVHLAMDRQRPFSMKQMVPMYLSVDPVQFWDELGTTYLDINLAIPTAQLKSLTNNDSTKVFETGYAILDSVGNVLQKGTTEFYSQNVLAKNFFKQTFKTFPTGTKLFISAHVRQSGSTRLGGVKFSKILRKQNLDKPSLSDLLLASSIVPGKDAKSQTHQGLNIEPNPTGHFDRQNPVYLYYEIYNLTPKEGLRSYKIEQTVTRTTQDRSLFNRLFTALLSRKPQRLAITRESQSAEKIAIEYGGIDFSKWEAGPVELKIEITDSVTGEQAQMKRQFFLD